MKIEKTASGKQTIKLSKKEWANIGKKAGWIGVESKKSEKKDPCWDGYEAIGTKKKDGEEVPNCVPKKKLKTAQEVGNLERPIILAYRPNSETLYFCKSDTQGEKMIPNALSMAYVFPSESEANEKMNQLSQKYKGLRWWEIVNKPNESRNYKSDMQG
jgi:hypothetical protein